MKTNYKKYSVLLLALLIMVGCKKQAFIDANISPGTLYNISPEDQFLAAATGSQDDFEYYGEIYRALNVWLQYATNGGATGNSLTFTNPTANLNVRYGKIFYGRVGPRLTDAQRIIDKMPDADKAKYTYINAIVGIFKAYYAFYVSDINGSIPYTEALQYRYGGTLTPKYDRQEDLFNALDNEIKAAVAALKSTPSVQQTLLGQNDPFFGKAGNQVTAWTKAGNALRLKIAMRLMKRNPTKLKAIATEVLADPVQMSASEDSWILNVGSSYADGGGNYNPAGFYASRPIVNFMSAKADPRLRIFYRPNNNGVYVGSFPSPDDSRLSVNQPLYTTTGAISQLQHRLFTPNYNENDGNGVGSGDGFFEYLTYAEYCFLRADLIARNMVSGDAKSWYEKGVAASIDFYNKRAIAAKVSNYTPVTASEITNYLAAPGVAYDANKALEQIACQAYLDFYRQPNEAWAWWKRTGYPNTTSVLPWANLTANGAVLKLTRRAGISVLPETNANFANQKAAIAEMQSDPGFGAGPNDAYGRVWWDMQ